MISFFKRPCSGFEMILEGYTIEFENEAIILDDYTTI
jgi:hypothetical protein